MTDNIAPVDFPFLAVDKLRYSDTDRQGHVNNAVFATLLETGRVEFIFNATAPLTEPGSAFVLAHLAVDYLSEINWPGSVQIGTRIASVGRSSVKLEQALFQNECCVANAETIIVLMDETTRKSRPFSATMIERLSLLQATGK